MSDQVFNDWYDRYVGEAIDKYAGLDTTNPKGIAQDAWQAAIEADRQRRGEPVAFAKDGNLFWRGDPVAWREFSGELCLAPQPTEPVKVPSDEEIEELWQQVHQGIPWMSIRKFARALLARYGQNPTIPAGWQLVPKDPTEEMLAATSWPNCAGTDYKHMLAAAPEPPCAL